jgi:hypothetical protein
MWTVSVEMVLVLAKNRTSMLLVIDEHPVSTFGSDAADEPLGNGVPRGERGGVLTTSMPALANTASKGPGDLGVPVPDEEPERRSSVFEIRQ